MMTKYVTNCNGEFVAYYVSHYVSGYKVKFMGEML